MNSQVCVESNFKTVNSHTLQAIAVFKSCAQVVSDTSKALENAAPPPELIHQTPNYDFVGVAG